MNKVECITKLTALIHETENKAGAIDWGALFAAIEAAVLAFLANLNPKPPAGN